MTDKEKLKLKIEEQRQLIRPKNTGEMKAADIPTPLEQGWLNALKWMDELVDSLPEEFTSEQDSTSCKIRQDIKEMVDRFKQVIFVCDSYGNSFIKWDTKSIESAIGLLEKAVQYLKHYKKGE